jgi:hypothetical protein
MPWIPIYADSTDFQVLHEWLNQNEEIAFVISDGPSVVSLTLLYND